MARLAAVVLAVLVLPSAARAFVLDVRDQEDGSVAPALAGYYWTLQEDTTTPVTPGIADPDSLSFRLHTSHAPVVAKGEQDPADPAPSIALPDPNKRYFISVLPKGE
jgi:hypothetical protein